MHKFTNANLIPVVNTIEEYNRIKNAKIDFAIHIDTGINRLGISSKDIKMLDLKKTELIILWSLAIPIIFFGFYPDPLISTTEISVNNLLKIYNLNLEVNLTNFLNE